MSEIMREHRDEMIESARSYGAETDLLVAGFVSESMVQSFSEGSSIPYINAMLQPHQATASGPASLNPFFPRSRNILNRWAGYLTEQLIWSFTKETTNYSARRLSRSAAPFTRSYLRARRTAGDPGGEPVRRPPPRTGLFPPPSPAIGTDEEADWQPPAELADSKRCAAGLHWLRQHVAPRSTGHVGSDPCCRGTDRPTGNSLLWLGQHAPR
ncbi:MAG: hypothetical protein R2856_33990 [Caldilineaceae bacterium]